jgi:hypothetical protein
MEQGSENLEQRKDDIVICPFCRNGVSVQPFLQKQDSLCEWCHGNQYLPRNELCICGRPVRLDKKGLIEGQEKRHCGRPSCAKAIETKAKQAPVLHNWPGADADETQWRAWAEAHYGVYTDC